MFEIELDDEFTGMLSFDVPAMDDDILLLNSANHQNISCFLETKSTKPCQLEHNIRIEGAEANLAIKPQPNINFSLDQFINFASVMVEQLALGGELDFFTNALNQKYNTSYWYSAIDIQAIGEVLIDQEVIALHKPVNERNLSSTLSSMYDDCLTKAAACCVCNINNSHWLTLVMFRVGDECYLLYKDSLYVNSNTARQLESFIGVNFPVVTFVASAEKEQHDVTSCGIFALHNMQYLTDKIQECHGDINLLEDFLARFSSSIGLDFCTQEKAEDLRQGQYAELFLEGKYQQEKDDHEQKELRQAVREYHHSELSTIRNLFLQSNIDVPINILSGGQYISHNDANIIGLEIATIDGQRIEASDYHYCYRISWASDVVREQIRLLKSFIDSHPELNYRQDGERENALLLQAFEHPKITDFSNLALEPFSKTREELSSELFALLTSMQDVIAPEEQKGLTSVKLQSYKEKLSREIKISDGVLASLTKQLHSDNQEQKKRCINTINSMHCLANEEFVKMVENSMLGRGNSLVAIIHIKSYLNLLCQKIENYSLPQENIDALLGYIYELYQDDKISLNRKNGACNTGVLLLQFLLDDEQLPSSVGNISKIALATESARLKAEISEFVIKYWQIKIDKHIENIDYTSLMLLADYYSKQHQTAKHDKIFLVKKFWLNNLIKIVSHINGNDSLGDEFQGIDALFDYTSLIKKITTCDIIEANNLSRQVIYHLLRLPVLKVEERHLFLISAFFAENQERLGEVQYGVDRLLRGLNLRFNDHEIMVQMIDNYASKHYNSEQELIAPDSLERDLNELLDEIARANGGNSALSFSIDLLRQNYLAILSSYQREDNSGIAIKNWQESDILEYAKKFKEAKYDEEDSNQLIELLAVIKRANIIATGNDPRATQLLSILIMMSAQEKGMLLQIATGEGKSTITAIMAVVKCMYGHNVDIVTSSSVLAKRDSDDPAKKSFYMMFGLSVASNITEGDNRPDKFKPCYESNIVYGDVGSFQYDWIYHNFKEKGTRGSRPYDVMLVDEVDSMLIDESGKIAMVSSSLAGAEFMQSIYSTLWRQAAVLDSQIAKEGDGYVYVSGQYTQGEDGEILLEHEWSEKYQIDDSVEEFYVRQLSEFASEVVLSGEIRVPNHLSAYIIEQVNFWVKSLLRAKAMSLEKDYIIKDSKGRQAIMPVDYTSTGVINENTQWNDGLHQFLQLKHGLKLTKENLTTCYISNMQYFLLYKQNIYGMTGTLGSQDSQDLLQEIYKVDICKIPTYKAKKFIELPARFSVE